MTKSVTKRHPWITAAVLLVAALMLAGWLTGPAPVHSLPIPPTTQDPWPATVDALQHQPPTSSTLPAAPLPPQEWPYKR